MLSPKVKTSILLLAACWAVGSCDSKVAKDRKAAGNALTEGTPSGQVAPHLSVGRMEEIQIGSGAELYRWPVRGRGTYSVCALLESFEDGHRCLIGKTVFRELMEQEEFSGEVGILIYDGSPFGVEGMKAISLLASFPFPGSFATIESQRRVFLFDSTDSTQKWGSTFSRGDFLISMAKPYVLLTKETSGPDVHTHHSFRTPDELLEYSKEGRTIIALTLSWEPQEG